VNQRGQEGHSVAGGELEVGLGRKKDAAVRVARTASS